MRIAISLVLLALLSGCSSARIDSGGASAELVLTPEVRRHILVSLDGSPEVKANKRWHDLRAAWRTHLGRKAFESLYRLTFVSGQPKMDGAGVLVTVDVRNFRYVGQMRRYFLGPTTGNAWIEADVTYHDLRSGRVFGSQTLRSHSSGWGTFFSSMTERQVEAMAENIIDEVRLAEQPPSAAM